MKSFSIPIIDNFIANNLGYEVGNWGLVRQAVIGYVLRLYDSYEFNRLTDTLDKGVRKNFRIKCRESSELLLEFKMAVCLGLHSPFSERKKIFMRCKVSPDNVSVYDLLDYYGLTPALSKKIKGLTLSYPKDVKTHCGKALKDLESYIKRFAYKKLRFISNSNNMDISDIINIIYYRAIQAYYNEIPYKDGLYLFNTVKSKIHSEGINMIKFYNTSKRCRLKQNEDGTFTGTVMSNIVSDGEDDFDLLDKTNTGHNEYAKINLLLSMESLKAKYKRVGHEERSKKYEALEILSMQRHEDFVNWFNKNNDSLCEDVEDVYDYLGSADEFLEQIRKYFNAGPKSWSSFLDELKSTVGV